MNVARTVSTVHPPGPRLRRCEAGQASPGVAHSPQEQVSEHSYVPAENLLPSERHLGLAKDIKTPSHEQSKPQNKVQPHFLCWAITVKLQASSTTCTSPVSVPYA